MTFKAAAQEFAAALQQMFDESVIIARAFVRVPYGSLPLKNKQFVQKLAESAGAAADLKKQGNTSRLYLFLRRYAQ